MKNMKKRWSIFAVGIAAVVLVVGAIITVNVKAKEEEKLVIPDRVYIGDVSVAGMTAEEASKAVEEYVEKLEDTPIKLEADGNSIDVTAKDWA